MRSVACRSETGPASPSRSSKASRPLPSPLSFTGVSRSYRRSDAVPRKDLARQSDVRLRAFAFAIEVHGGRAAARGLRGGDGGWDHGFVHLLVHAVLLPGPPPLRARP